MDETTTLPADSQLSSESSASFFLPGDNIGVLLLHAYTSTPFVLRDLGQMLSHHRYTVSAPLLAGHGTTPEELADTTWEEWYRSAKSAYDELRQKCDMVFVIGTSLGGNVGCILAARHKVDGLILLSTPRWINLHYLVGFLIPICRTFGMYAYRKPFSKKTSENGLLGGPTLSYPIIPLKSAGEAWRFISRITPSALRHITCPTLIIQSNSDGLVKPASGKFIFSHIRSKYKQLVWISEPHHAVHTGNGRTQTYRYIFDFVRQWSGNGGNHD